MKTELRPFTVREVLEGFEYSEAEGKGLFGLNGRLVIQPEYQRHYIYGVEGKDAAVVESLLYGHPLGLIYFNVNGDLYETLDGQQRITSIGRFVKGQFSVRGVEGNERRFLSLNDEERERLLDSTLLVYLCEGTETEIKDWFQTINIAGSPLNKQEVLNAVYSGPFVSLAKAEYSDSSNSNIQLWSRYMDKANPKRQEILETALRWIAHHKGTTPSEYFAQNRAATNIDELKRHFESVIKWVSATFPGPPLREMKSVDWGKMYEKYHRTTFDPDVMGARVAALMADGAVTSKKGIFEYLLSGEKKSGLLSVRIFPNDVKRTVYAKQTQKAEQEGVSNCPSCAASSDNNSRRIYQIEEMDADHVTAWSKGGSSDLTNCQMLCSHHNKLKGNK